MAVLSPLLTVASVFIYISAAVAGVHSGDSMMSTAQHVINGRVTAVSVLPLDPDLLPDSEWTGTQYRLQVLVEDVFKTHPRSESKTRGQSLYPFMTIFVFTWTAQRGAERMGMESSIPAHKDQKEFFLRQFPSLSDHGMFNKSFPPVPGDRTPGYEAITPNGIRDLHNSDEL